MTIESFRSCLIGPSRLTSHPSNYESVLTLRARCFLSLSTIDVLSRAPLLCPADIGRMVGRSVGRPTTTMESRSECQIDITDRQKRVFVNIFVLSSRVETREIVSDVVGEPSCISEPPCMHAPPIAVNRFLFSSRETNYLPTTSRSIYLEI